jgi:hypothetical protein
MKKNKAARALRALVDLLALLDRSPRAADMGEALAA